MDAQVVSFATVPVCLRNRQPQSLRGAVFPYDHHNLSLAHDPRRCIIHQIGVKYLGKATGGKGGITDLIDDSSWVVSWWRIGRHEDGKPVRL